MIKFFFGENKVPSDRWMIRVMNFGHKGFGDVPSTRYEIVLEKSLIDEITRSAFRDIKEEAKDLDEDKVMDI